MQSSNISRSFSRVLVFTLSISLMCVQTLVAAALPAKGIAAAEITVKGPRNGGEKPFVVVNGERAFNGRTFFSNGTISTTETSSATVSLGKLGRINLAPSSSLSLTFAEGQIEGELSNGTATFSNTEGVSVKMNTPHDSVKNEGTSSSRFSVTVMGGQTGVAVESGTVRYHNGTALTSKQDDDDDDDDDDDWKGWAAVAAIGGAIAVVVIIIALSDDDDDTVSPVR